MDLRPNKEVPMNSEQIKSLREQDLEAFAAWNSVPENRGKPIPWLPSDDYDEDEPEEDEE